MCKVGKKGNKLWPLRILFILLHITSGEKFRSVCVSYHCKYVEPIKILGDRGISHSYIYQA